MGIRQCVSFDDAISYFFEMVTPLEEEMYEKAMNRLNYENEKAKGATIKKLKRINGKGYFEQCGNCGSESINGNPHWKYCPNCGYAIIR